MQAEHGRAGDEGLEEEKMRWQWLVRDLLIHRRRLLSKTRVGDRIPWGGAERWWLGPERGRAE